MKQFPRIYSVSTVGLIFHYNSDYLLHPFRTDFNGESGIGKSMVADLLQLIFIAKRKYYKPGTDSTGSAGRDTNTLPLDSIGYAMVNIQKSEELFLTIGVYIQKSTGNVTPFIVQKGIQWEKNSSFEYQDKILLHEDFLLPNKQIPEIDFLKKSILKPKGFILETFHNDVSRYHQLLFFNQILPMDLSQDEDKLFTYSQIIQSFARAKTLSLKTKEFKNFLFADDEDIFEEYRKQITSLENYHRQYIEQRKTIARITDRFDVLKSYKDAYIRKEKAFRFYLSAQTAYDYQQSVKAQEEYDSAKRRHVENSLRIFHFYLKAAQYERENACEHSERIELASMKITAEEQEKSNSLERVSGDLARTKKHLQDLQGTLDSYVPINNGIMAFEALLNTYSSAENIEKAINKHPEFKLNKSKLESFLRILNQEDVEQVFKDSYFILLSFEESFKRDLEEQTAINEEIKQCEDLIEAYSSKNVVSIMHWVSSQGNRSFTKEEESVLRHFIQLSTRRPMENSNDDRYIPSPSKLLKDLKVTDLADQSFWIDLGGIIEKVPLVREPAFSSGGEILKNVESLVSELREALILKNQKRGQQDKLSQVLRRSGWSHEIRALLDNRESILSFQEDTSLPTLSQFAEMKEWYSRRQYHEKQFQSASKELTTARDKERDLQSEATTLATLINGASIKLTELSEQKQAALNKQNSKEIEVKTWLEKIEGIRVKEFQLVNDHLIQIVSESINQVFNTYVIDASIDTSKLYQTEATPLENANGALVAKIKDLEDPLHINGLRYLEHKYTQSMARFLKEMGKEFNALEQHPIYTKESVDASLITFNQADASLNEIHETRVQQLLPDNDTIKSTKDVETIARELLPNVFDGKEIKNFGDSLESIVTGHLNSINETMKQIDEHKIRLISGIFNKVSNVYYEFEDKIKDIKKFFDEKEITGGMKVKIDFQPSPHYPIEWISALKKQIGTKSINITPLFKNTGQEESSAEEIIINSFRQYSSSKVKDPDIKRLTNPKSYFDVEVSLVRPSGEKSDGSSGQDYAKIALLCIARLSRIEKDKTKKNNGIIPGIRFMPIDEVAGLGGNFNLLYQIAQEYDYQIITMTISPDLVLEDGKQYVYILNSNRESNERKINMPPFGLFSDTNLQKNISSFIKAQTNAKRVDMADNK